MLGLAAPVRADPQPGGKRVALVIGNGSYRNVDRCRTRQTTPDDRRDPAGAGFTLVGAARSWTWDRAHLAQAVQDFGRALAGAEVGLF